MSYWLKEYNRIAREKDMSPDHVYAIGKAVYLSDEVNNVHRCYFI